MTERRRPALRREDAQISIGPSRLTWDGDTLVAEFDEITAPLPSRLRGTVRLRPEALPGQTFSLDANGRHTWRPLAPRARVDVSLTSPECQWSGAGYFDTNSGEEPLEREFASWDWARAQRDRDTLIFYDVERVDGLRANLAVRVDRCGRLQAIEPPPRRALPSTFWRVPRTLRSEAFDTPNVRKTLVDAPFYARSLVEARYGGEPAQIVHESLSLRRLRSPIVRAMLPFRMPRVFW